MVGGPAGDMQFLPVSADFIRHFSYMSALGAPQHPQQGPLIEMGSGGGGGGNADGGDGTGGGSGSGRPVSGLLWPGRI